MSQFKIITEAVLRNSAGGELFRGEVAERSGYLVLTREWNGMELSVGDTITIEERETEPA